jgi:hypothetical protein
MHGHVEALYSSELPSAWDNKATETIHCEELEFIVSGTVEC